MNYKIPYRVYFSQDDNCWYVESPQFYDGIITYGNSFEEAKAMADEAINGLLYSYLENGDEFIVPEMPSGRNWFFANTDNYFYAPSRIENEHEYEFFVAEEQAEYGK